MTIYVEFAGKVSALTIPYHPRELKFGDFCDFRQLEAEFMEANDTAAPDDPTPTLLLRKAVEKLVPGAGALPVSGDHPPARQLIDEGRMIQWGDDISLVSIYAHLLAMAKSYTPDTIPQRLEISHRGETYVVHQEEAARVLLNVPLTVGEVVEVAEFQKRADERERRQGRYDGNIDFNLGLSEFAILVRREGEELPSGTAQRAKFIDARKRLFADLPLDQVFAVRFFLLASLAKFGQTPIISTSAKVRQVREIGRKSRRREIWRRRFGR